ncbi:MAG: AAA family ATPase, partial [Patescibacteria group bacterium]
AKILAETFFGKRENLLRFDMSFYQEQKSVSELIGSFQLKNPGLLAATTRENPYCVLLIDEIEKAHKDILSIFLTMLDEGYLVDGFGEKVDCKNLIIVATSNAGSERIRSSQTAENQKDLILKDVIPGSVPQTIQQYNNLTIVDYVIHEGTFTPEFINRFDNVLVFESLTLDVAYAIGAHVVNVVKAEYMKTKNIDLAVDIEKVHELIRARFNPQNGARDIDRAVRDYCADAVAEKVLSS